MTQAALPRSFDAATYRAENPDLPLADDQAALNHYVREGRAAGRVASLLARREGLIAAIDPTAPTLEIGPFCSPLLRGPTIAYFDALDAPQLRRRAVEVGRDPSDCPDKIDYVGDLTKVDRRFANVVASHSIEHHPDLIRHLAQVATILDPGGRYWLIVPDRRFCFDHFLPESTVADVLDAYDAERKVHNLRSVIEHWALVTHNDAARHWRGDHGDISSSERAKRVDAALRSYRASADGYIDVHAWQFTPDSFRELLATLEDLDLSSFEVEAVYDTPRDRQEFCAVLRRRRPVAVVPPGATSAAPIIMMQTSDPIRYAPMLALTALTVTEYCRRRGYRYEAYTGVRRGAWPWQATFNRIPMLQDLLDRDFRGWAIYLDADAYVNDLDFDLGSYLLSHADKGAIFARSGVTHHPWDVNAGIAFVNFGHPQGRRLVRLWSAKFAAVSDERLVAAQMWMDCDNDQDLLHQILREDRLIAEATHVEEMALINAPGARFLRQQVRALTTNLDARLADLGAEVRRVLTEAGCSPRVGLDERTRAGLLRPTGYEPALVEAGIAEPDIPLASSIAAWWRDLPDKGPLAPHQQELAALLDRGSIEQLAIELARFGRTRAAEGLLGGRRQHQRVQREPGFARQRALVTHDALVSLAEATGAAVIEAPGYGPWGVNASLASSVLADSIARTLGVSLDPPRRLGGYLGVEVGDGVILHLRAIEAIHAAWRLDRVAAMLKAPHILEIGGGLGFTAWYGTALGLTGYRVADAPILAAVRQYALGRLDESGAEPTDILFTEDCLSNLPEPEVVRLVAEQTRHGARALLAIDREAQREEGTRRTPLRHLLAPHGWSMAWRAHHDLRAGYVEELFVRD